MHGSPTPTPSNRVTVVHLIHTMAYGGVETVLLNWLRGIDRTRFDVHLVCFANPGATEAPFVAAAERAGMPVSRIPWGRRKPILRAARALARLLRERRADILHTHNWYADFVGAVAIRLAPVRSLTTLYVWFDYDWKRNVLQWIDRYVIRSFDQITAHCEETRRQTIARGIPPERVGTLICGFESRRAELTAAERSRRRHEAGVADDDVLLVNVARLYPEKTQARLLRCYARIRERCPRAHLWIAGVGPLEEELRALSARLGLDSRVRFLGFVDELPELLALADIQVHPAAVEGVPLAVCSGMAAELPIVASEVGGLPEIVADGHSGILVRPGDEDGFVAAVLRIIEQPEEGRRLGRNARHFIETEYSLGAAVRRLERTYENLLGAAAESA